MKEAMTDFTTALKDMNGEPLQEQVLRSGQLVAIPMTLGRAAANALIQVYPDEVNVDGAEKVKRFALAMKVIEEKKARLTAEEITSIKERIARSYGPLIVGRAFELLDPAALKG